MAGRPLEHLVLISIAATGNADEGDEGQIVLLAWQTLSIVKNQVGINWETVVEISNVPPPEIFLSQYVFGTFTSRCTSLCLSYSLICNICC